MNALGSNRASIRPLFREFPWLTLTLYVSGSLVLARIALGAIRAAVRGDAAEVQSGLGADRGKPFLLGLSITLFNPTTIVSWLSIGGSFIALHLAGASTLRAWAALLAVFAGSALWWACLAGVIAVARQLFGGGRPVHRVVNLAAGAMLAYFAFALAYRAVFLLKAS